MNIAITIAITIITISKCYTIISPELSKLTLTEMATHQSIRDLHLRAVQNGLVIHLHSLHFKAKKTDVEQAARNCGFDRCTFHWAEVASTNTNEHNGWCRIQFPDRDTAKRATSPLNDAPLMGINMKTGTLGNTAVSTCLLRSTDIASC